MLPRRCKKCRCYVAPQLTRCPRCNAKAPPSVVMTKPTKAEKAAARIKRDANVPVIQGKNIHWVPSAMSVRAWRSMTEELKRRMAKADTPRMRNAIRSEARLNSALLARVNVPSGKKAWTSETFHAKHAAVCVFISPKKIRYVLAQKDGPADLIIQSRKKNRRSMPFVRLQRFEKSPYARQAKKDKQEQSVHHKRKRAKKERRVKKRAALKSAVE